jgi:hypothetical protein
VIARFLCAIALLAAADSFARDRPMVLVRAEAPLDGGRLADAMRAYVDGWEIRAAVERCSRCTNGH